MENSRDNKKAHFTYLWVLEDVSKWHLSKTYRSSVFIIDSMERTKWQLTMDLATTSIVFYIQRADEDDGPNSIEIDYEIAFLGADKSPLVNRLDRNQFGNSSFFALRGFEKTKDVLYNRKNEFLPNDKLTVRCRMWRTGTEISTSSLCFVRTRKRVDRVSFVWKIKDFSTLLPREKRIHLVNPSSKNAPKLILTFYLCEIEREEYAFVEIDRSVEKNCQAIFGKISLLDADGKAVKSTKVKECFSESNDTICLMKQCYKKSDFMSDKETLLPNDVLSLRCEFDINVYPTWIQKENYSDFKSFTSEVPEIHFEDKKVDTCMTSCSMKNFFRSCYEEGILSDVSLQAGSETFPVHKAMLCICSPVFKAMLTKWKQKTGECVMITGIREDTLRYLLTYIYTNTVPELKWNDMVDLYKAADEYELYDLREICSSFLKVNISLTNFSDGLILADEHQDLSLQRVVHNFVFIHNDDIFHSDDWQKLKISEPRLAMETTESIICSMEDEEIYYVCPDEDDKFDYYNFSCFNNEKKNGARDHMPLESTSSGDYITLY